MMQTANRLLAQGGGQPGGGREPLFQLTPPQGLPTNICVLLDNIANFLIAIAVPIATIVILWSAFQFLTSGGNENQVSSAKKTLLYAIIGLVVVLIAKGIATIIGQLLGVEALSICPSGSGGGGGGGGGEQFLP